MVKIEECNQHGCIEAACIRIHWPDKNPYPVYCVTHAHVAMSVLTAMGWPNINAESYSPKLIEE